MQVWDNLGCFFFFFHNENGILLFWFGSLVVLDVVFRYLSLFLLYLNINIDKNKC